MTDFYRWACFVFLSRHRYFTKQFNIVLCVNREGTEEFIVIYKIMISYFINVFVEVAECFLCNRLLKQTCQRLLFLYVSTRKKWLVFVHLPFLQYEF